MQADQHHALSATSSISLIHSVTESAVVIFLAKKEEVEIHKAKKEKVIGDCSNLHRDMLPNFTPTCINYGKKQRMTLPEHVAQLGHLRNIQNFRLENLKERD